MYTNTKEVIDQIARYNASGFKDNNLVDQILSNYSNFDSDNKKEVEQYMYVVYRGKFDSLALCQIGLMSRIYKMINLRLLSDLSSFLVI